MIVVLRSQNNPQAMVHWGLLYMKELGKDAYALFDLPGQVELTTNHDSLKGILRKLTKSGFRVRSLLPLVLMQRLTSPS